MSIEEQIEIVCRVKSDVNVSYRQSARLKEMYAMGLPTDADIKALHRVWLNRRFQELYKLKQG